MASRWRGDATNTRDARLIRVTSSKTQALGGRAGIAELFGAQQLDLVRLATLLVGDQATAEDVVQDVFVSVCRRWERLTESGLAVAYFRTAVVNACRSVHRRRSIARRFGLSHEAELWAEPGPSAESAALLAEDRRRVLRALAALPPRQREALVLRYYQRLTEPEIAQSMGISRGTVKSTLSRGLDALAGKLGTTPRSREDL
jgi:RNA polymerase sigma-70 factor (sigma-E family)